MFLKKHQNAIILLIIFLIVEVFVCPIGEFCLNDDWAYAASVRTLLTKNVFEIGTWPAMTLYFHVLWGFFFVKIFGFSFTVLRFSGLVLSFITLFFTEKLFFRLTKNKLQALIVPLLLLTNPLFLCLSNSYMTDISFMCFFLISIYYFYVFYSTQHLKFLFIGFGMSIAAIFIRQLGIVIPLCFILTIWFLFIYDKKWKKALIISLLIFAITLLLLYWFEKSIFGTLPDWSAFQGLFFSQKQLELGFIKVLEKLYVRLGLMFLYTGLFLFPILLPKSWDIYLRFKSGRMVSKVIASFFFALIVFVFHYYPCGNYLYNCGLGLITTADVMTLNQNHFDFDMLFVLIKAVSVVGNVLLIMTLFSFDKRVSNFKNFLFENIFLIFCLFLLLFYQILITLSSSFFDRYSLCFFILCLIIVALVFNKMYHTTRLTFLLLFFYASFSIVCVKDYFNYNKVKTTLINKLEYSEKADACDIDGGFEYNMWNLQTNNNAQQCKDKGKEYTISFSHLEGYSSVNYLTYQRYIPYKIDTIFVLKKNAQ